MSETVSFQRLVRVLTDELGLDLRVRGSHHLFTKRGSDLLLNLQPYGDDEVKRYQLAQLEQALRDWGVASQERWAELLRKAQRSPATA